MSRPHRGANAQDAEISQFQRIALDELSEFVRSFEDMNDAAVQAPRLDAEQVISELARIAEHLETVEALARGRVLAMLASDMRRLERKAEAEHVTGALGGDASRTKTKRHPPALSMVTDGETERGYPRGDKLSRRGQWGRRISDAAALFDLFGGASRSDRPTIDRPFTAGLERRVDAAEKLLVRDKEHRGQGGKL